MKFKPKPPTASRLALVFLVLASMGNMPTIKLKPKPQTVSRIALVFLILAIVGAIPFFELAGPRVMSVVFPRKLGAGTSFVHGWMAECDGYNTTTHAVRQCTRLIECVYGKMLQNEVADVAIGGTIAGLLPTILIILAPPPQELVEQGLVSPHRAIALSLFSIGIPSGVFQKLGPTRKRSRAGGSTASDDVTVVTWPLHFAKLSRKRWLHILLKITGDIAIVACAGVVLWQAWLLNQAVMVPWKCETPVMTFAWTVACMFWVVVALLLLHSMVDDIHFEDLTKKDLDDEAVRYRWWEVWLLPYTLRSKEGDDELNGINVVWNMPKKSRVRSWLVYECLIEVLAAAVYVYGTLAWLSALFLGAVNALQYVALTVGMFVVVRIVSGTL